jgi:hypothetical protein
MCFILRAKNCKKPRKKVFFVQTAIKMEYKAMTFGVLLRKTPHRNQTHTRLPGALLRRGSQILRICFWRGAKQPRRKATAGGPAACGQTLGPERESAEPRKARFSAQPKMRPNEILKTS